MNRIKQIPIPFCGVALGLAAAGNLLQGRIPVLRPVFGIAAAVVLSLFLLKVILFFPVFRTEMQNPVMASVSGTFCMAWMLLSVYMKPWAPLAGEIVWYIAVLLHAALILYFSVRFMRKLKPSEYHASFYIVYVGIATASISAPAWNMQALGKGIGIFALAAFLLLVCPVTLRYRKKTAVPAAVLPLFTISAAPASLCIAGLKNSFGDPWLTGMLLLFALGTLLYVPAVILAIRKICSTFYPSFAAFTFPLVISAIASGTIRGMIAGLEQTAGIAGIGNVLLCWFTIQQVIAVGMTLLVLGRFLYQLFLNNLIKGKESRHR